MALPLRRPLDRPRTARVKDKRRVERYLTRLHSRFRLGRARSAAASAQGWGRPLRLGLGFLLIIGGLLGFLPILGYWMIPLGLLVLAQDIVPLRRPVGRTLVVAELRWRQLRRWWR